MTDERIQEIVLRYGYDAQSRQCIEKMAELTQAINLILILKMPVINAAEKTMIICVRKSQIHKLC